ncbi:MAG: glycosyltransferase [Verrucomicrobiota bacterium]|jgi:glycosyltransferase involved in cell wall biosynthesis
MENQPEIISSAELEASQPRVSVSMITYNHERFIRQAVESALSQQTSFPIEVIVGEDCSNDATSEILRKLQREHPDRLKLILQTKNAGMGRNSSAVFSASRGEYVAFLEGDDFWTDPLKLQKQVDFLDHHPDCVLCHHRVRAVEDGTGEVKYEYPFPEDRVPFQTVERFFVLNFIQTCSALVRRRFMPELDENFMRLRFGDYPLFILLSQHGPVAYLDEAMADYRIHSGGVHSKMDEPAKVMAMFSVMSYLAGCSQLKRPLRVRALRRSNSFLDSYCTNIRSRGSGVGLWAVMAGQAYKAVCLLDLVTAKSLGMFILRRGVKLMGWRAK